MIDFRSAAPYDAGGTWRRAGSFRAGPLAMGGMIFQKAIIAISPTTNPTWEQCAPRRTSSRT